MQPRVEGKPGRAGHINASKKKKKKRIEDKAGAEGIKMS